MKAEDITLESAWAHFVKLAIPEGAPQVQHDAMYMAFLAGCTTILELEGETRQDPLPHARRLLDRWADQVEKETQRQAQERH